MVVDAGLRLRYANARRDILATPMHGLGEPIDELVGRVRCSMPQRVAEFSGEGRREIETIGPTGPRYYLLHVNAITTEEGDVHGHTCLLSDVTELRELDNLNPTSSASCPMSCGTPGAVKSYADTLVIHADRLDEAKKREFAEVISQEVDRLARLIDAYLDISRIEAGRALDLVLREVDAAGLAHRAATIQTAAEANAGSRRTCPRAPSL